MMFSKYQHIFTACCFGLLAACTQPEKKQAVTTNAIATAAAKPTLMEPFRYHKLIESSPGKYFDVLSWGRGVDSTGSYMILRSDSTGKQYSTTTGDLEGAIIDVYNTDMNMDGYPEILIESKAKDTTNHINIYAYEFRGAKGQKIDFPKLTSKTKKDYRGDDKIYIKEGNLIREFPVFTGDGKEAKPTGKRKVLQYGIRDNIFTVTDITPADTSDSISSTVKDTVKKSTVSEKKKSKKTTPENRSGKTKAKHHPEKEKHTKKKKHRRHRE